ncbi:MAG: hypothetical protein DHS20C11_22500 [Lysobacteraceae bacterium]|nr:MAG: hypothetical protein DHS20C11_22500 [Xanthomonadaceae bacterium]
MQAPIEIPNFVLEKEIGRGGMAKVYLARQIEPARKVAIKIVAPDAVNDESFVASLKKEGDTAAQFSHDNIVTIYACGVISGHYYMAMEILPNGDLTDRIKKGMQVDDALKVTRQVASALGHAHGRNTLHRDIKPENIMFHESDKAVLVDFGIAKDADSTSNFTKAGAVVGTPHYMAPERVTGKPIDSRSDIYALGVVLYEMLVGKKLYEGKDTFAVSYAHVYEPIPDLPADLSYLQPLLDRLVAKEPDDRFQSAEDVVAAIDEIKAVPAETRLIGKRHNKPAKAKQRPAPAAPRTSTTGTSTSKWPAIAIGGTLAGAVIIAVVYFVAAGNSSDTLRDGELLEPAQRIRMQELLDGSRTLIKFEDYDQAEANYVKVLQEYDCTNLEARSGLRALNESRLQQILSNCRQ